MRCLFPTESVVLGILLFSGSLPEAMTAGVLLLAVFVLAEVAYGFLEKVLPSWSLWLCLMAGAGVIYGCAGKLALFALGFEVSLPQWILQGIIGILAARHVLENPAKGDYNGIFWEYAVIWGLWLLFGGIREVWGLGELAGYSVADGAFLTKGILTPAFGLWGAGILVAAAGAFLGKGPEKKTEAYLLLPLFWYWPAFELPISWPVISLVLAGAVTWLLFYSLRKKLIYSQADGTFGGLPLDLLSLGILYMILGIL
ncbi:MAG: hypothetical protein ACOYBE_00865 [Blautia sp.]|jgi:hypothetical protein